MKVIKEASGKTQVRMSEKEWKNIGVGAGWLRHASNNELLAMLEKTLAWAAEAPDEPAWPNAPVTRNQYVEGFARKSGSYVPEVTDIESLKQFLSSLEDVRRSDPSEMPEGSAKEGYEYWEATVPEGYSALENISLLSELDDAELGQVQLSVGGHGVEFNLPSSAKQTNTIKIITNPEDGFVTWYPGRYTPHYESSGLEDAVKGGLDLATCSVEKDGDHFQVTDGQTFIPIIDAVVKLK